LNGESDKETDNQFKNVYILREGNDFGAGLNKILAATQHWLAVKTADAEFEPDFVERIGKYVLNPGTLHYSGGLALFSKNALSLREFGFDGIAHTKSFSEIADAWQKNKTVPLSFEKFDAARSTFTLKPGVKYAVWGTGSAGSQVADAVKLNGACLAFATDIDVCKHGKDFYGVAIGAPETLREHLNDFEYLIAANYTKFNEIKRDAVEFGIEESRILLMNQL
jgi:hypothetical protein